MSLFGALWRLREYQGQSLRQRQLSQSAGEFIEALEAERARIARELHDNAGQSLAGILLNLELVHRHLGSDRAQVLACLARSRELASVTLDQIRRISHELNPPEWNELDFPEAAAWLVESMGLRDKLLVEMGDLETPQSLPAAIKTILYRTLQEGLSNVLRHSGASRVAIQTPTSRDGVSLVLEDDGRGFDPAALPAAGNGIGLANMRRRVTSLGGKFELVTAPGRGVRLAVFVPFSLGGS